MKANHIFDSLIIILQVLILALAVGSKEIEGSLSGAHATVTRDPKEFVASENCKHCSRRKNFDITSTYIDAFGVIKAHTINSRDLSSSWVVKHYDDDDKEEEAPGSHEQPITDRRQPSADQKHNSATVDPQKLERRKLREERRNRRTQELIHMHEDVDLKMQMEAIERSKTFDVTGGGKYNKLRREFYDGLADRLLKYMKDQAILARVYSSIARSDGNARYLSDKLNAKIKLFGSIIGEATSDRELKKGALDHATAMGKLLADAKFVLYNCETMARKLRAMVQFKEGIVTAEKKKSLFLMEFVTFSIPKPLHCLALQLTNDYFLHRHYNTKFPNMGRMEDPSLYHYAIFSDNVLATWVVVKSTLSNAKEPEKHVFHIVTDRLQFPAMKMWFITHPPLPGAVNVQSIDEFKWLNSSYCPVLRQLESEKMKEFYFRSNHPSKLSGLQEQLKYKNPKYLSMLNHIRFYMPELYPKLDKMLFLDDDVVVQRDLTPLWSIDMKGMVNGAVETCKKDFHQLRSYLNFSNPEISRNFDPLACGWAFGMNIFDLKEWRKQNLTGVYHHWQELNKDRLLWSLGTLPPGLMTFYKRTYPLDKRWHLLALGYRPAIKKERIKEAAVIHFNGNNKPWLDIGYANYRRFWSRYIKVADPYLQSCNVNFGAAKG